MLTHFHRMVLRMLPGPFFGWLGTLMFLLLMQFLIRYLPDIVGKGLPLGVIAELIVYNLAYMVVLAVPMSALISTIMTFGRLAETKAYAVIKGAGVSLPQLAWPVLLAGLMLAGAMAYFNNMVLPEANFRAKNLWMDIRQKKPGFELEPGVFYEGINDYSILVRDIDPETDVLHDVVIYDYSDGSRNRVDLKATRGRIVPLEQTALLDLVLEDGEIHRVRDGGDRREERYERLRFERHRLRLDLSDFAFERSDPREGYRSDRTMRTPDMVAYVDSLDAGIDADRRELVRQGRALAADTTLAQASTDAAPTMPAPGTLRPDALADTAGAAAADGPPARRVALAAGTGPDLQRQIYDAALNRARLSRSRVEDAERSIAWEGERADRYRVEIHKKQSIALACFIFVLIGAPLGLSIRRGGLGAAGAWTVGIFLFFWVSLVQGEKLADRGHLEPWLGMWGANLITGLAGLWLLLYVTYDLGATARLRRRLRRAFRADGRRAAA